MIELKHLGPDSWLSPLAARRFSAKLSQRLWDRCRGHRGLFVTLTYDRSKYKDALDLYRRQSEEQHVPLFLRKIERRLGEKFTGRWFCKMEFQKGGWVHWHIIILDVDKIPHAIATELWGRGHVWLRRLNQRNVKYCTKYTCKPGDVPAWLYLERPRATKIVRVSPGFWGEPEVSFDEAADADGGEDPYDVYGPQPGPRIEGIYKPIGESLEVNRHRYVARDERGKYRGGSVDFGSLLVALLERGCAIVENRDGWLVVDATWQQLARAEEAAGAAAAAAAPPPLHLREAGNPDGGLSPRWLYAWFDQRAREEVPG